MRAHAETLPHDLALAGSDCGSARDGFSKEELKETLMQTAIYAGVPAANTAFAEAAKIIAELEG